MNEIEKAESEKALKKKRRIQKALRFWIKGMLLTALLWAAALFVSRFVFSDPVTLDSAGGFGSIGIVFFQAIIFVLFDLPLLASVIFVFCFTFGAALIKGRESSGKEEIEIVILSILISVPVTYGVFRLSALICGLPWETIVGS
jgi:hypothetical protein